ncbi:T9SS C-terminal target domain-containing protein, partial [Flavobacterium sp. NRK F10]|nr:T9SS C-terminal target domain-containing protein [Flavobacterium sp. NRK F10]
MRIKLRLTAIFPALLIPAITSAQDILWEKTYGGKHAEYLYDAISTPDYGFILAGSSVSGKNGNKDEKNKGD